MITFTFTLNPKTQEAVFAGNIDPQTALQVLQQLVISEAIRRAKEEESKGKSTEPATG